MSELEMEWRGFNTLWSFGQPDERPWSVQEINLGREKGFYPGDDVFVDIWNLVARNGCIQVKYYLRVRLIHLGRKRSVIEIYGYSGARGRRWIKTGKILKERP